MRFRRRHHRALWLALTLQLLFGGHAVGELSLCIAEDGHRAIELAHARQPCRREVQRHHPAEDVQLSHGLGQHPCHDVLLVRNLPAQPVPSLALAQPSVVTLPALAASPPAHRAQGSAWRLAPVPPGLAPRRTVVIRA